MERFNLSNKLNLNPNLELKAEARNGNKYNEKLKIKIGTEKTEK